MTENLKPIVEKIDHFDGDYRFLSNFDEHPIAYGYFIFGSNEALFQSRKAKTLLDQEKFVGIHPSSSKRLGRKIKLREDWVNIKDAIMFETCRAKFAQNPELLEKLIATGDKELIEGNTWDDQYWGVCNGIGKNQLGLILMDLRTRFQDPDFLRESLFLAKVNMQYAGFIKDQMDQPKISIINSAYEIGFYGNLYDYLTERFIEDDDEEDDTVEAVENAFIEGTFSFAYLYERFLKVENASDSDCELLEFFKDELRNHEMYKFQ